MAHVLGAASDIALLVDSENIVRDVSMLEGAAAEGIRTNWIGQSIKYLVTDESEQKVINLIEDARAEKSIKTREINHALAHQDDFPVRYRAVKLNDRNDVILFGYDFTPVAELQRKLVSSQLAMEREFSKLKSTESRFRTIFHNSGIPQLVVDAANLKIVDINEIGLATLGLKLRNAEGMSLLDYFGDSETELLHKLLLATVDDSADADVRLKMPEGATFKVNVKTFRQDSSKYLLLEFQSEIAEATSVTTIANQKVLKLIDEMPDAFVMTDSNRIIENVNGAFLEMMGVSSEKEVSGKLLDEYFVRPTVDCRILMANVREHRAVRRFATMMQNVVGQQEAAEIAATRIEYQGQMRFGFWIRATSTSAFAADEVGDTASRSNEQIANLVGHMPLRDIVRETTESIEQLCIETALDLTRNNRASAAQMLGLSRQSLYAKLARADDTTEES